MSDTADGHSVVNEASPKKSVKNYSRYLIDEQPIYFHPSVAVEFGLEAAAFLQRLHFRIQEYSEHEKEERWWVYDSYEDWLKDAPYLGSAMTLRRIVDKLRHLKIIITKQWGKPWGSMRLWYTIDYEVLDEHFAPIRRKKLESRMRRDPSTREETERLDELEKTGQNAEIPSETSVTVASVPPSVQNEHIICSKRTDVYIDLKNTNKENKENTIIARVEESPSPPPKKIAKEKTADVFEMELPSWLDRNLWHDWLEYRRDDLHIKPTLRAARIHIRELTEFREEGYSPEGVVHQSMSNNYRGLFRIRGVTPTPPANGASQTGGTGRPSLSPDTTSTVERMLLDTCETCEDYFLKQGTRPCQAHPNRPAWIRSAIMVRQRVKLARWQQLRLWLETLSDFKDRYGPWLTLLDELLFIDDDGRGGGKAVHINHPIIAQDSLLEIVDVNPVPTREFSVGTGEPSTPLRAGEVVEEDTVDLQAGDPALVH